MLKKLFATVAASLFLAQSASADDLNLYQQLSDGGMGIFVIFGLSILMGAVTIERFIHFRQKDIIPNGLIAKLTPLWRAKQFNQIKAQLADDHSTLAQVITYLVDHRRQEIGILSTGAGDVASLSLRHHQQKAYPLAVVATVAPIVGLLGTVIGMIEAFHVIAFSGGMGDPALLAGGISKALINTAAGLTVALPSLGLHHFFKNRQMFYGLNLEKQINLLINDWFLQDGSDAEFNANTSTDVEKKVA